MHICNRTTEVWLDHELQMKILLPNGGMIISIFFAWKSECKKRDNHVAVFLQNVCGIVSLNYTANTIFTVPLFKLGIYYNQSDSVTLNFRRRPTECFLVDAI